MATCSTRKEKNKRVEKDKNMPRQKKLSNMIGFWTDKNKHTDKITPKTPPKKNLSGKNADSKNSTTDSYPTVDTVLIKNKVDMTRKTDFKKRLAEMKLKTKDSPILPRKAPKTQEKPTQLKLTFP